MKQNVTDKNFEGNRRKCCKNRNLKSWKDSALNSRWNDGKCEQSGSTHEEHLLRELVF